MPITPGLPRSLGGGVYWLGACQHSTVGVIPTHNYSSTYLVAGDGASIMFDSGHPKDWRVLEEQLDSLMDSGVPPVTHIFPTHPELAHSGALGRLFEKFPAAVAVGEVRDYHLFFPEFEDRLVPAVPGEEIDVGGRAILVEPALFRDLVSSLWAYDRTAKVLFTGDGYSYTHSHGLHDCGKMAEELPELPLEEFTAAFSEASFYWTRFCDLEPTIARLEALLERLDIACVAPGHGCPITDPRRTGPKVMEGLRLGQRMTRAEIGDLLAKERGLVPDETTVKGIS